jgi:26S proteasome regulatory subunit T6
MGRTLGDGLKTYYKTKIEELEILARDKQHNLHRLEAQRNELNTKGIAVADHLASLCAFVQVYAGGTQTKAHAAVRLLREELQLLQEPGSYVGEVVKVCGVRCRYLGNA